MAKLNPRRRAAKRARLEAQGLAASARALMVPDVPGWKRSSLAHHDSLKGVSHTPGFSGAGKAAGWSTVTKGAKADMAKSRVDMQAQSMFGKVLPPKRLTVTAPKSKPFNKDGFDDGTRKPREGKATVAPWSAKKLRAKGLTS